MRINRGIRALKVRLIGKDGDQIGILPIKEALTKAEEVGLDLVEIAPKANPPVCKIIDYGKFQYDQTKRKKESKKAAHQVKVKEIKIKPNIDEHDLQTKLKHARSFLEKGNKVKVTCMFRGREMRHKDVGHKVVMRICDELKDIAAAESNMKMMGRFLSVVLASLGKSKKKGGSHAKNENL